MNAISPAQPASAAAENIGMLQELIVSGMQLARSAARHALRDMEAADASAKTPGAAPLFLRLWSAIRQTMALQTRLAPSGKIQPRQAPGNTATQVARNDSIKHVFDLARKPASNGSLLPPATLDKLERELARSLKR